MELKHFHTDRLISVSVLLIVPYGIETISRNMYHTPNHTFNRTLWN